MLSRNFYINIKKNYLERLIKHRGYFDDTYYDSFLNNPNTIKYYAPYFIPFTGNIIRFSVDQKVETPEGISLKKLKKEYKKKVKRHEPLRSRFHTVIRYDYVPYIKKDKRNNHKYLILRNKLIFNSNWFSRLFFHPIFLFFLLGDIFILIRENFMPRFRKLYSEKFDKH